MKLSTIFRRIGKSLEQRQNAISVSDDANSHGAISVAMSHVGISGIDFYRAWSYLKDLQGADYGKYYGQYYAGWNHQILMMYFAAHLARSEGL